MKLRWLITLGALSFCSGLLLLAPAATLYGWLKPKDRPPALEIFGLHGTLSEGGLSGIQFNGRPVLNDIHWTLKPLWLLLARAAFHVDGGGEQAVIDGDISLSLPATLSLHDFRVAGALKPLLAAVGQPYLPVDGQVRFDLQQLKFKNGMPAKVEGVVQVQGLVWTLAKDPLLLGDYQAILTSENADSITKIESTGGPLELSGDGKFAQDQSYEINLKLRPKAGASPMLRNLISSGSAADPQGYYHIRQQGKLKQ